jgi:gamma-glutamyltranspeptidase / glutathione hydrolase
MRHSQRDNSIRHGLPLLLSLAAACAPTAGPRTAGPPRAATPTAGPTAAPILPGSIPQPQVADGPDAGRRVVADHGAVASANGLASQAGVEILRAGGNAVDAAVATAFAIGVVEPEMSGLGASGGMLIWLAGQRRPYYLDFYASQDAASWGPNNVAPYHGGTDLRIVGVPGDVAGLLMAHERFGKLPLERVMAPAIRLAEGGYPVGQILGEFIAGDSAKLHRFPEAAAHWWPDGEPLPLGAEFRNPELAASLRKVAQQGRAGFYQGSIARHIVAKLNVNGNPATLEDLATFQPRWKRPLCADYHGLTVLSAPPPQTGMQVLETLQLLQPFHLRDAGLPTRSARAFDLLTSALRVGMADARINDDPRWAVVPARGVASKAFADSRRALVGTEHAPDSIAAGDAGQFDNATPPADCRGLDPYPPASTAPARSGASPDAAMSGPDGNPTHAGETTHISVADEEGDAVALTQTNSDVFGSGAWVDGFFLNDSGYIWTDGGISPPSAGPWRTRISTISPTIVLRGDSVQMVVGAPGGGRIPTEIAQVMVYTLDYGMDPLVAVLMPRIFPSPRDRRVQLEHGFRPELLQEARAMGYEPVPEAFGYARLYLIVRRDGRWIAVSDPRHDGEPRGY